MNQPTKKVIEEMVKKDFEKEKLALLLKDGKMKQVANWFINRVLTKLPDGIWSSDKKLKEISQHVQDSIVARMLGISIPHLKRVYPQYYKNKKQKNV